MTVAIIQARMGSSRLPGKVLRPLGDRPVLGWVVRAARAAPGIDGVVVATSTDGADDAVADAADQDGAAVVRGPVDDVLARYLLVLDVHPDETVVRLTADCPLLDPTVIGMAVAAFAAGDVDYLSTTAPRTLPRGLDVEVVAADALRIAGEEASGVERVHVTAFVHTRPDRFRLAGLAFSPPADDLRVTLDTEEDAQLLERVVAALGSEPIPWRTLVRHLREHPEVAGLNASVRQKTLSEG